MKGHRRDEPPGGHLGEALYEYVSGRLAAEERLSYDAHLKRCPSCRDEASSLRRLLRAARAETPAAPAWLSARALERVVAQSRYEKARAGPSRLPWWRRFVPQLAAASTLAAAALVALVLLRPAFVDAVRWTTVRGAKGAAAAAPPVAKAADHGQRIGKGMVLAIGKAIEVTFGF